MSTIVTTSLPSSNTRSKTRERILKFVVSKSAIANSVSKRKGKKEKIATEGEQLDLGPGGARNKAKTISTSSQPETNRKQSRQTTAERNRKRKSRDEVPQSKKRSKSNTKRKNSYRELSPDRSNDPTKDVNKRKEKKLIQKKQQKETIRHAIVIRQNRNHQTKISNHRQVLRRHHRPLKNRIQEKVRLVTLDHPTLTAP